MIVDEMHEEHPELLKDQYWDDVVPKDLPYTIASEHYRKYEPKGSAEDYKVKEHDALYANLLHSRKSIVPDDVYADYVSRAIHLNYKFDFLVHKSEMKFKFIFAAYMGKSTPVLQLFHTGH